ncbi:hypothetical protein [Runella aurantiaca]|nr:hypothetical protein [Runella aurantiaca]
MAKFNIKYEKQYRRKATTIGFKPLQKNLSPTASTKAYSSAFGMPAA